MQIYCSISQRQRSKCNAQLSEDLYLPCQEWHLPGIDDVLKSFVCVVDISDCYRFERKQKGIDTITIFHDSRHVCYITE